jgi:DNA-binding transcriptional MerR regulator
MSSPPTYAIRELAEEFGLTARAIRFYEDKGLIAPSRLGQMRLFSHRDRVRLSFIARGKRLGFSLADIKDMLDLYDLAGPAAQLAVSLEKFRTRIVELEAQRGEIDAAIRELKDASRLAETRLAEETETPLDMIGYGLKADEHPHAG